MGSIEEEGIQRRPHVLAIPYSTQGHITPMLSFLKEIAKKGITVTFVTYETELFHITSKDTSGIQNLDIRFVGLHNLSGLVQGVPSLVVANFAEAFKPVEEKLMEDKLSGVAGPTCIVSDMFISFSQDLGEKLQIPFYMFVPSGANFARFMQGSVGLFEQGHFQISETNGKLAKFDGSVCIPGLSALRYHELALSARIDPGAYLYRCRVLLKAAGVLVNSFYELDEHIFESWKTAELGPGPNKVSKIYPIGPLGIAADRATVVRGLEDSANICLTWLSSQPTSSVLYVAFGTWATLSQKQVHELALGLESSEQRFLWVLPDYKVSTVPVTEMLPPGFQARVQGHGCIITGWAPQLDILAHPSTSAFLTHSGWNSTLESITMGIPMIAWPQTAEQHLNCRYVVDDLKIAYELDGGVDNIVEQKDVERVVRRLMVDTEGKTLRNNVQDLQQKYVAAIVDGGSRSRAIQEFVDDLYNLQVSPCLDDSEHL